MLASSTHAVLLAGGTGSRMPPLVSSDAPKCLLTVANRPMIFYSLFSLTISSFSFVTVIVSAPFLDSIRTYCEIEFPSDPLVTALSCPVPTLSFVTRGDDDGTADALRDIDITSSDVLVLSSDYVGDIDLAAVIARHRATQATATVALLPSGKNPAETQTIDSGKKAKEKKPQKKKPSKSKSSGYSVEGYALLSDDDDRLLGLFSTTDVSNGYLALRSALVLRYPSVLLRSDLVDPHVYVFNTSIIQRLLQIYRNISSVKYDLVPYLARRQHTLNRDVAAYDFDMPMDEIAVFATILRKDTFARRANTVDNFHSANMDVAAGALELYLQQVNADADSVPPASKKKGKKPTTTVSPFESEGERVTVTSDSLVGPKVTAGDRASIKKSVIGANCSISSNVKVNSCVVLNNVTLEDGVNLAGCIICDDAIVGTACVLKDCRVAKNVTIEAETDDKERDFTQMHTTAGASLDQGFEFC